MCPVCAANAAIAVASVGSTGGLVSLAVKRFRLKRNAGKLRLRNLMQALRPRDGLRARER
jgi:hypothetical protein